MFRPLLLIGLAIALVGALPENVSAQPIAYSTLMDGPSEAPPNASPGTGFALAILDVTAHTLFIDVSFTGLVGTTTVAHIHAPTAVPFTGTASVATQTPSFVGWPAGVTSGVYTNTFDTSLLSTWNPSFVAANGGTALGAEAAFAAAMASGSAYFNVHSSAFPGGEIRGFFISVPEPSTVILLGAGTLGAGLYLNHRRSMRKKRARA